MVKHSFENRDQLIDLAAIKRNGEIVDRVIQSVRFMKLQQKLVDGTTKLIEGKTLIVQLPWSHLSFWNWI